MQKQKRKAELNVLNFPMIIFTFLFIISCGAKQSKEIADPIKLLNPENILSDLYNLTPVQNDSLYHKEKDDGYLDRCATPHIHRSLSIPEKNELSTGKDFDTVYSKILNLLKASNDTVIAIIETVPEKYECHACATLQGVAMYVFNNSKWWYFLQNFLTTSGGFGHSAAFPTTIVKFSESRKGLAFTSGFMGQGYVQEWSKLFALVNNHFYFVWGSDILQDNSGACDEENGIKCWAESTSYQFIKGKNVEWYNIKSITKGTATDSSGEIVPVKSKCLYVFTGKKYVPKDSISFYSNGGKIDTLPNISLTASNITKNNEPNLSFVFPILIAIFWAGIFVLFIVMIIKWAKNKAIKIEKKINSENQAESLVASNTISNNQENPAANILESPNKYKKCPICAENVLKEAKKCRYCGKSLESFWNRDISFVPVVIFLLLIAAFLGFFHIVPDAPSGLPIVPKAHFTYTMTVISIEDFLNRWNSRTLSEAIRGDDLLENLHNQFSQKGWVVPSDKKSNIENTW